MPPRNTELHTNPELGFPKNVVAALKKGLNGDGGGSPAAAAAAAPEQALLYTATTSNPNFYLSPTVEEAADTIASAVGPSGPNHEYLFHLAEYLKKVRPRVPFFYSSRVYLKKVRLRVLFCNYLAEYLKKMRSRVP